MKGRVSTPDVPDIALEVLDIHSRSPRRKIIQRCSCGEGFLVAMLKILSPSDGSIRRRARCPLGPRFMPAPISVKEERDSKSVKGMERALRAMPRAMPPSPPPTMAMWRGCLGMLGQSGVNESWAWPG